jgi:hypothetical protein
MNKQTVEFNAMERAFYYAVRLLARMDECAGAGNAIDVPELVVWAVQHLKPRLIEALKADEVEILLEILRSFQSLRSAAEKSRARWIAKEAWDAPGEDEGNLTLHDLSLEIDEPSWASKNSASRNSVKRVVRAVADRYANDGYRRSPYWDSEDSDGWNRQNSKWRRHRPVSIDLFGPSKISRPSLEAAVEYAQRQMLACDDGYDRDFWFNIRTFVLPDWLAEDFPDTSSFLKAENLSPDFTAAIASFVGKMRSAEYCWNRLSRPIRAQLLESCTDQEGTGLLIKLLGQNFGVDDSSAANRLWDMIKRRAFAPHYQFSRPIFFDGNDAFFNALRNTESSADSCFVVDTSKLPVVIGALVKERCTVVVRMSEKWRNTPQNLEDNGHIQRAFFQESKADMRLMLQLSNALWCDDETLWPHLLRFRRTIPVVYLFEDSAALVCIRFNHFTSLQSIGEVSMQHLQSYGPASFKGKMMPEMKTHVVDLTSSKRDLLLAKQ